MAFDLDKIQETIDKATDNIGKIVDFTNMLRQNPKWQSPRLYESQIGKKASSIFQQIIGYGAGGVGLAMTLSGIIGTIGSSGNFGSILGLIFGTAVLGVGIAAGASGTGKMKRTERFERYRSIIGRKTVINFIDLAHETGESVEFIRKDIHDMVVRKMFVQGHFDDEDTMLILSDEAYGQYRNLMASKKQELEDEAALVSAGLTPAGKEILKQGEDYIARIHAANDRLPGVVISAKLQTLEDVIERLIQEVKKQPSSATELRKLMNYYLPTTWKLIESYEEIEAETVKTPEMKKTEDNIEATLDTINAAFERLLDNLFRKQAVDISSDISVLNTMLTQEGLKDSTFTLNREGNH